MIIVGLNLGQTKYGKNLKDGGACLLKDGVVQVTIAEERLSRHKAEGGFQRSLQYCLSSTNTTIDDVDLFIVSTCVEKSHGIIPPSCEVPKEKTAFIPSHHLSHAFSAYFPSPFDRALVLVADAGGNIISEEEGPEWWKFPREQLTAYVAEGYSLKLIDRDFDKAYNVGLGEAYRAFTHYLGWNSYIYSGKTMALAAHGDPNRFKNFHLFYFKDGHIFSELRYKPSDPIGMISQFAKSNGLNFYHPKKYGSEFEFSQIHKDLAAFIQRELESALIYKIKYLSELTGIKNLCLAGGVALNCVANSKIAEKTGIEHIFVQPASGDQGQCLGNALYGYYSIHKGKCRQMMSMPYFGREYDLTSSSLWQYIKKNEAKFYEYKDIASVVAKLLASGHIVCWYLGRSEFGPRALGNRSLLADPRDRLMRNRLNGKVKGRESFLPYAISILEQDFDAYFGSQKADPYMLFAPQLLRGRDDFLPVVHVDGTVRVQTVNVDQNPLFYRLISQFKTLTGVPFVLNTSLNGEGEPICETPFDAYSFWSKTQPVDFLAMGNVLFSRNKHDLPASYGKQEFLPLII